MDRSGLKVLSYLLIVLGVMAVFVGPASEVVFMFRLGGLYRAIEQLPRILLALETGIDSLARFFGLALLIRVAVDVERNLRGDPTDAGVARRLSWLSLLSRGYIVLAFISLVANAFAAISIGMMIRSEGQGAGGSMAAYLTTQLGTVVFGAAMNFVALVALAKVCRIAIDIEVQSRRVAASTEQE